MVGKKLYKIKNGKSMKYYKNIFDRITKECPGFKHAEAGLSGEDFINDEVTLMVTYKERTNMRE